MNNALPFGPISNSDVTFIWPVTGCSPEPIRETLKTQEPSSVMQHQSFVFVFNSDHRLFILNIFVIADFIFFLNHAYKTQHPVRIQMWSTARGVVHQT